jgi:hypothetical protein
MNTQDSKRASDSLPFAQDPRYNDVRIMRLAQELYQRNGYTVSERVEMIELMREGFELDDAIQCVVSRRHEP